MTLVYEMAFTRGNNTRFILNASLTPGASGATASKEIHVFTQPARVTLHKILLTLFAGNVALAYAFANLGLYLLRSGVTTIPVIARPDIGLDEFTNTPASLLWWTQTMAIDNDSATGTGPSTDKTIEYPRLSFDVGTGDKLYLVGRSGAISNAPNLYFMVDFTTAT